MTETRTKRAYHSPLRQRRAAESRQRIIESALSLFNELGYSGTTMSAIAKRASVSVESVHGVGQKGDLLLLAFRLAYNGDSRVTDPSWFDQVDATDDPEKGLDLWIAEQIAANERAAGLWLACRTAAAVEPAISQALQEQIEARLQGYVRAVRWMARAGLLDGEPPEDRLIDFAGAVNVMVSPETYIQLVHDWGFDHARYEGWLRRALTGMLAASTQAKQGK